MISEMEVILRFTRLEKHTLHRWIAAGWVRPRESATGFLFDDIDIARTHLLCDLCYDMALADEELTMVLSLVDQLHGTRSLLSAVTAAIQSQPEEVRDAILSNVRVRLVAIPTAVEEGE